MKNFIRRHFLFIFIFILIFSGILIGFFYENWVFYKSPDLIAKNQISVLVEKIGKLAFLPQGETPSLAIVSDPELLKGQPFFIEAKKGDQVLIYANAKKAILYDPVANKIVNIATLNVDDKSTQSSSGFQRDQPKIPDSTDMGENQF